VRNWIVEHGGQAGVGLERAAVDPGLGRNDVQKRHHPDRYLAPEMGVELRGKPVAHRREAGRRSLPVHAEITPRRVGVKPRSHAMHDSHVVTEQRLRGREEFAARLGRRQAHHHVGLSGRKPHLAHEHIGDDDRVTRRRIGHREIPPRRRRDEWIKRHFPEPGGVGHGPLRLPGKGNLDWTTGAGPSPHRHRSFPLEHHAVGKDAGQLDRRLLPGGGRRRGGGREWSDRGDRDKQGERTTNNAEHANPPLAR
jgi:hypothetical protein